MEQLWTMIDKEVLVQLGVLVAVFLFLRFEKGKIPPVTYGDMKTTLFVFSTLFKMNKKQRAVYNVIDSIVEQLEKVDIAEEEKKKVAISVATKEISKSLGVKADEKLVKILVITAFERFSK